MFASYLTKQESVNPQGFSTPRRANAAAFCKSAHRKMRSQMQIAKRFANENQNAYSTGALS